ncbi:MAG: NAD(P)/FAD-dependent oxidoreductase [Nitrospinae bacterium]|nr:NAD(P)/FAD-dependent oxidoreductase [Nitrospinota bacterium]
MADYDVIVIGGGIGGLTSASLLSKRGLRVLVVEQNSAAGGLCNSISKNGYTFDIAASLFWGFGHGEVFHWLFSEFNIFNDLLERESVIRKIEPGLQVILPNHRINIYSERDRLYEELKREFPSDMANLIKFYQESDKIEDEIYYLLNKGHFYSLKNHYPHENKRLKKFYTAISILLKRKKDILHLADKWVNPSEIEKFIDLQLIYFTHKKSADIPLPISSIILGIPKRGIYGIKGGARILTNTLEKQLIKYGGKITCNSTAEEIILKGSKACGVKVRQGNSVSELKSDWVISDTTFSNMEESLVKKKRKKSQFSRINKKIRGGFVPFSVLLGIDEKVIPELMGEHAIMMRDYELPALGSNIIFISVSPGWDETRAPQGKRSITATYFLSQDEASKINWEFERENKTKEMIDNLEQLIPFISEFIDCAYSITPDDYQRMTLRKNGVLRSFNNQSGFYGFNSPSSRTPVKKLFMVGDEVFPGSGAAHTAKSGIRAAEEILKRI